MGEITLVITPCGEKQIMAMNKKELHRKVENFRQKMKNRGIDCTNATIGYVATLEMYKVEDLSD